MEIGKTGEVPSDWRARFIKQLSWYGKMKFVFALVIFICLYSCQANHFASYEKCGDVKIQNRNFCSVSFTELLGNPDALNGTDVALGGFITVENGMAFLLPTMRDVKNENEEVAVILDVSPDFFTRLTNGTIYVEIYGRFNWYPEKQNPNRRQLVNVIEQ